ncbi:NAD(P)-binding domain, partial [Trinorchestia longiramus]
MCCRSSDGRVVTVSSGGMLTSKLQLQDLQSERGAFDGTMVYAQNKRQQVVMTRQWAAQHPGVHFSSMHPGWADTPAVRSSMPQFYEKMKNKLRTAEQGADTAVWLAVAKVARQQPSGLFFQDRCAVSEHLPLAWSHSRPEEEAELMTQLEALSQQYR